MGVLEEARRAVELLERQLELLRAMEGQSTELLSLSRGHVDGLLLSGTFSPDPSSGTFTRSFTVPFRAIAFADPNNLGLTISTGTGGESQGAGVVATAAGDAGCVPLVGSQIHVTPGASGKFFLAVYSRSPGFFWG